MLVINTVAVVFLIAAVVKVHADGQSSCTTAHRRTGVCVPISTCTTITQLLRMWSNTPPPQVVHFVRQSYCGTFNDTIYVCCEQNVVTSEGKSPSAPSFALQIQPTSTTASSGKSKFDSRIHRSVDKSDADFQIGMAILEASNCGNNNHIRVSNGKEVKLSEFPWMTLLVYDDGGFRTIDCGGSLITDRHVLTAAHCITRKLKLVSVRLGEHDTKNTTDCISRGRRRKCAPAIQEIDIEEAIYHKDYNPGILSNDIGLIRLISRAIFRSNVKSICLPITPQSQAVKIDRMIIAGWSQLENGLKANVPQKAVVPMKDNNYCKSIYKVIQVTDKQLCGGGGNETNTCMCDSGGPLFFPTDYGSGVRNVQYGIKTASSQECDANYPDVFVRVISYLPWIAGNLGP